MACSGGCSRAKDGGEARLSPEELSQLLGDRKVREALQDVGVASLLPPVGTEVFRRFTLASLQNIKQRQDAERQRDKQHKPADQLTTGNPLPFFYGAPPPELLYTPLEELDPYYQSQTFLVLSRGNILHRFDADSSLYLLSPLNNLRIRSTQVLLSPWFRWFILVTLLINCLFMTLDEMKLTEVMKCVFVAVYTTEVLLKVVCHGLCVGRFSFIRDPWNFLDLLVLLTSFPSFFLEYGKCSVLVMIPRVLKIFSVSPGLRRTVEALIQSVRRFVDIFIITALFLCFLAVVSTNLFMGMLRNKCVVRPAHMINDYNESFPGRFRVNFIADYYDNSTNGTEFDYKKHVLNQNNWYHHPDLIDPFVCGNLSSSGVCPTGYICLMEGKNPNYGYTSYDSFSWSLLSMFRFLTLDFWENLFVVSIRAAGNEFIWFLLLGIFPICFMVLSLLLAVVVMVTVDQDQVVVDQKRRGKEEFRQIKDVLMRKEAKEEEEEVPGSTVLSKASSVTVAVTEADMDGGPPSCWQRLRLRLRRFVLHPLFDLGVIFCLIIDIVVMATEHYPMTEQHVELIAVSNLVFLGVYTVEMLLRLLVLGPRGYFQVSWHILDFLVVFSSFLEPLLVDVEGLSVLRCLRLLRMFRLARWWPCLQLLLQVVWCAAQGLTVVLLVLVFLWTMMGQQLFHQDYVDYVCKISSDCELPRWHMADLPHAAMLVCRVLLEGWIEILWDCMEVSGPGACLAYFLPLLLLGKLLILLLFFNLLLSSTTNNKLAALEDRIDRQTRTVTQICRRAGQNQNLDPDQTGKGSTEECVGLMTLTSESSLVHKSDPVHRVPVGTEEDDKKHKFDIEQELDEKNPKGPTPEECCCCPLQDVDSSRGLWRIWSNFRRICLVVVESKVFEGFMVFFILLSSMALVFEDVHLDSSPHLVLVLYWADLAFTLVFLVEGLLKWTGFGFRKYFSDFYCWLDFLVLAVSLVALVCEGLGVPCRPLRALRTLRILSRFQGLRVVLRSLLFTLPSVLQVALVVLFVWLMFGILGVNLFAGKFSFCFNETSSEFFLQDMVNNKTDCLLLTSLFDVTWKNLVFHFDNIGASFLSLLIMGTSKGIYDHLYAIVDSRRVEDQPVYEHSLHLSLYILCFLVFGCFFTFLLFVRVFVRSIQQHRVEFGGKHVFITEDQHVYPEGFKKRINSPWTCTPPQTLCQARLFAVVSSRWFEAAMMVVVFLDLLVLGLNSHDMDDVVDIVLHGIRLALILVFLLELVLKLVSFRRFYFSSFLNVLDFLVILLSILNIFLSDLLSKYIFNFDLVVLLRLARLLRVLWLFGPTRGIRTLLLTFIMSLSALVNVGFLLFLLTFTFAMVGMMAFGHVAPKYTLDNLINFQNFWNSLITMTMLSPWTGWDGLLLAIVTPPPDCDLETPGSEVGWRCATPVVGVVFFTSYILLFILLVVHLFTVVIMESFNARTPAQDGKEVGGATEAVGGLSEVVGGASDAVGGASEAVGGGSEVVEGGSEVVGGASEAVGGASGV